MPCPFLLGGEILYKSALSDKLRLFDLFRLHKWRSDFRKAHPYMFGPIGTMIFCGSQGKGKTHSAVNYVCNVLKDYPFAVLVTNVGIKDYPFNAYYKVIGGHGVLFDKATDEIITSAEIVAGHYKRVCVEYDGLDTLKYVCNGEYGVIYLIDELHLELNSLESKNIDIDVMTEISQQRKQRKHIVGTSQVYMRLAKPLREQIFDVIICNNFFHCLQFNKAIDGETAVEKDGKLDATVRSRHIFFHTPEMYERYDTFAKMKRYNKEWQGHKRETPVYSYTPPQERSKKK